jgi:hypothetical protein
VAQIPQQKELPFYHQVRIQLLLVVAVVRMVMEETHQLAPLHLLAVVLVVRGGTMLVVLVVLAEAVLIQAV